MKRFLWLLAFIFMGMDALMGQTQEIDALQKRMAEVFPQNPDSSIIYGRRLLHYSDQLNDSTVAQTYKKLGLSFGANEQVDSANYYFNKSLSTAGGDPLLQGHIYVKWAKTERDFGDYKKAHKILDTAETLFQNQNSLSGKGLVLIERGTIDHYNQQTGKAIKELKKAIKLFERLDEQKNLLIARQELAGAFLMASNYGFAKDLYAAILPQLKKEGGVNYYFVLVNYGDCFFELGEMGKARHNYEIAQAYLEKNNYKKYNYYVLGKIARVNRAQGEIERAKSNFKTAFEGLASMNSGRLKYVAYYYLDFLNTLKEKKKALQIVRTIQNRMGKHQISLNATNKIDFLDQTIATFKNNGLYRQALKASEQKDALRDSVDATKKEKLAKEIEAKYQNKYQRKRNKNLLSRIALLSVNKKKNRTINILLGVLVFLLIVVGILVYARHKRKLAQHETEIKLSEERKKRLEQKYAANKRLSVKMEKDLERKEREIIATSLQLSDESSQLKSILKKASTKEIAPNIRTQISAVISQTNYWDYFKQRFVEVYPDFTTKIETQFPHFTPKEVDFCMLLKLSLDNKEIARLLGISNESVITKKYRIRKKLSKDEQAILDRMLAS